MIDQTLAVAEALAIAGFVASIAQEAYLSRFEGQTAKALSVATALVIGLVATARVGGFAGIADPHDTFAFAMSVLASAGIVLAASQAAFRVLVRPMATLPAK